ncbi:methyltransferase domain-containing protein [Novipirellula artificiosorum]|uniref:Arsenite methyltransferase n=1 Tax=Novipirellula artificiosorum TaxID=2528016 RepID=A0A5C6E2L5_9BACT|nr:methyltransferase domain-containing protein [Novipirellula artificiosorum]TWU42744.1 arsenite S-adenosylmethyltransferase [Novipirellula artificiosorum]
MSHLTNTESVVASRYSAAAEAVEPALCCPVDYDAQYLKVIPQEVIDRDYGCGDPSKYVRKGETVLDLGSGGGKICFIAAQVVGESGRVIGVDMNDNMLALARASQGSVAKQIGYDNVTFLKGRIQDMTIDRDRVDAYLKQHPVSDEASLRTLEAFLASLRHEAPMIPEESVDVVVSNCVLNLVDPAEKAVLFEEIHRVLRVGGRAVISDIVCDQEVPMHLQQDPQMWSGCISGAFRDTDFVNAFVEAGFYGVEMVALQQEPWQVVEEIEFRSATVIAYKGEVPLETDEAKNHTVIYRGPFAAVRDEFGEEFWRADPTAVNEATFRRINEDPYRDQFIRIEADGKKRITRTPVLPVADACCSSGECC